MPQYDDEDATGGGCFGLFKRKRGETSPASEKTPAARHASGSQPQAIKAGGIGGVVPGIDAPVSAVNAGDRRVLVECGKSKTIIPVTPTTTPVDLIKSAANCMSESIDVRSAVLLEFFGTVGVQRPLRRYEHVRDVMNSWDTDRQNSLLLVDPGTGSSEAELSIAGVPRQKPDEASWLLLHSQKVGKWDKQLITLKTDGQITLQKEYRKPQHQENVCHMSDFDIYTPTHEKLRKKIKPPKKICFAIKSQQKTSMFESTQNFVHFFCTGDRATADSFYSAVQGWRSWYLVNVMGEGKKAKPTAELEKESGGTKGHRPGESFDSHYQLGSFQPLFDTSNFEKRPTTSKSAHAPPPSAGGFAKSATQFDTTVSPERRTSTSRKHPPVALNKRNHLADDEPLANFGRRLSVNKGRPSLDGNRAASDDEFDATGLLGRGYSQRQRERGERDQERQQPFTSGPNLLNGGHESREFEPVRASFDGGPRRNLSTRTKNPHKTTSSGELRRNQSRKDGPGARGSIDLQRSGSKRAAMPEKPLIDLTPQYREPPQHVRKGKGHHPDQLGPGGLIDNATSLEDSLGVPPSTDWRGRNAQTSSPMSSQHQSQNNRARSMSRHKHAQGQRPATSRSPDEAGPFTGEGLLAGGQQGWGGGDRGRGYMDGSHAKGPLLDVNESSKFAQGSLLSKVERERPDRPVIDRGKRNEKDVPYGEGY